MKEEEFNMFGNFALGFCMWDIPALIVLLVIIGLFVYESRKNKKEKENCEE